MPRSLTHCKNAAAPRLCAASGPETVTYGLQLALAAGPLLLAGADHKEVGLVPFDGEGSQDVGSVLGLQGIEFIDVVGAPIRESLGSRADHIVLGFQGRACEGLGRGTELAEIGLCQFQSK